MRQLLNMPFIWLDRTGWGEGLGSPQRPSELLAQDVVCVDCQEPSVLTQHYVPCGLQRSRGHPQTWLPGGNVPLSKGCLTWEKEPADPQWKDSKS